MFNNERNEALVYHFVQKDAYDLGLVAKVSYIYDILIYGFKKKQKKNFVKIEEFGQNVRFSIIGGNTKENI